MIKEVPEEHSAVCFHAFISYRNTDRSLLYFLYEGALFALKRKKMFEAEVMKLQGAKITLESQIMALESAVVNIETFHAMSRGAVAMKGIRGNL